MPECRPAGVPEFSAGVPGWWPGTPADGDDPEALHWQISPGETVPRGKSDSPVEWYVPRWKIQVSMANQQFHRRTDLEAHWGINVGVDSPVGGMIRQGIV